MPVSPNEAPVETSRSVSYSNLSSRRFVNSRQAKICASLSELLYLGGAKSQSGSYIAKSGDHENTRPPRESNSTSTDIASKWLDSDLDSCPAARQIMETLSQQEGMPSPGTLGRRPRGGGHRATGSINSCQVEAQADNPSTRYRKDSSRTGHAQSSPRNAVASPATSSPDLPSLSKIREFAERTSLKRKIGERDAGLANVAISSDAGNVLGSQDVTPRAKHREVEDEESPVLHDAQMPQSDSQMPDTQVIDDAYSLLLADHIPESKRFLQPVTPASHIRRSMPTPSTGDTPKLPANLLGGAETPGLMGLTQLFKASSPILRRGSSNLMSDRPSPGFRHSSLPLASPKVEISAIEPISSPPQERTSSPLMNRFSKPQDVAPRQLLREEFLDEEADQHLRISTARTSAVVKVMPTGRKVQLKGDRFITGLPFTAQQPLSTIDETSQASNNPAVPFTKPVATSSQLLNQPRMHLSTSEMQLPSSMGKSPGLQTAQEAHLAGNPPQSSDTDRITETQKSHPGDDTLPFEMDQASPMDTPAVTAAESLSLHSDPDSRIQVDENSLRRSLYTAGSMSKSRGQARSLKTPRVARGDSGFFRQLSSPVKGANGDVIPETVIKKRPTTQREFGRGQLSGLPKFSSTDVPRTHLGKRRRLEQISVSNSSKSSYTVFDRHALDEIKANVASTAAADYDSPTDEDDDRSWLTAESKLPEAMVLDNTQPSQRLQTNRRLVSTLTGRTERQSVQLRSPAKSDGSPQIIPPHKKRRKQFSREIRLEKEEEELLRQIAIQKAIAAEAEAQTSSSHYHPSSPVPSLKESDASRVDAETPQTEVEEASCLEEADSIAESAAQNRVFAQWRGNNGYYYPATVVREVSGSFRVRFEDGNVDLRSSAQLRALELREGDLVKVDMDEHRKHVYVVSGFGDSAEETPQPQMFPSIDTLGHPSVLVRVHKSNEAEDVSTVSVPVSSLYLTKSQWKQWNSRLYKHKRDLDMTSEGIARLPDFASSLVEGQVKSPALNDAVNTSILVPLMENALFDGMCFTLSFFNEAHKPGVLSKIVSHGGTVLEDGFQSTFQTSSDTSSSTPFSLSLTALKFGFSALITEKHSRRPKFMQALALGLPCLSYRWIEDCVAQRTILSWAPYLLPAGESNYLGGAVRSRMLKVQPSHTNRLTYFVEQREKLLEDHSVVVVSGKGKAEEKRKAHIELAHILAPRALMVLHSVAEAKEVLKQEPDFNLLYVSTADDIHGDRVSGTQRRRKKSAALPQPANQAYKIITDEMIIQSLILGKLIFK